MGCCEGFGMDGLMAKLPTGGGRAEAAKHRTEGKSRAGVWDEGMVEQHRPMIRFSYYSIQTVPRIFCLTSHTPRSRVTYRSSRTLTQGWLKIYETRRCFLITTNTNTADIPCGSLIDFRLFNMACLSSYSVQISCEISALKYIHPFLRPDFKSSSRLPFSICCFPDTVWANPVFLQGQL